MLWCIFLELNHPLNRNGKFQTFISISQQREYTWIQIGSPLVFPRQVNYIVDDQLQTQGADVLSHCSAISFITVYILEGLSVFDTPPPKSSYLQSYS